MVRRYTRSILTAVFASVALSAVPLSANADFQFRKVVDTNTFIPQGGGAYFNFGGSDVPNISGDNVVFQSAGTIWRASKIGRNLKRVITPDDVIPGGWGTFKQAFGNYVQVLGDIVVVIADSCGGCGAGVGIFTRHVSGGVISKLVDMNDKNKHFPGDDKKFGGFLPDFRVGQETVVFTNRQNVFSVPIGGGDVKAIAGEQDKDFAPPAPHCCLFSEPSIVQDRIFMRGGNVFGRSALQTVNRKGAPLSFRFIVAPATHLPHTPSNYGVDDFQLWGPVADETLVFGAGSIAIPASRAGEPPALIRGIYSRGAGKMLRLVDDKMNVPGGSGKFKFDWYGTASPIVAGNGIVVFGARDAQDKVGLYAVRQTGGPVHKIIAQGDPIKGFVVQDLRLGREGMSGNTLVFGVAYAGFLGFGMYSAVIDLPQ